MEDEMKRMPPPDVVGCTLAAIIVGACVASLGVSLGLCYRLFLWAAGLQQG